ncbi:hypothetical protein CISG_04569 [Coccidioides immitis RMSCC 3703]|uniref:Uncharacterized protein n=1 Tax=Coccidioides immitis RMSCC 3703 TaxID=454286 RepID=A0A0J8QP16_COCIT|nr:hypothetical protein CISG_04569 [Coccidioides immitis RMSCC 3703]
MVGDGETSLLIRPLNPTARDASDWDVRAAGKERSNSQTVNEAREQIHRHNPRTERKKQDGQQAKRGSHGIVGIAWDKDTGPYTIDLEFLVQVDVGLVTLSAVRVDGCRWHHVTPQCAAGALEPRQTSR